MYFYPLHAITVTNRNPHFVTPYIKALLRKRNKLMRKGCVDAAESLTARIGQRITSHNKTAFLKCPRSSREMWNLVRSVTGKEKPKHSLTKDLTVSHLNQQFSAISTDSEYKTLLVKHAASLVIEEFTEWHIFRMLDTIHPTAMGLDGIPENVLFVLQPQLLHGQ